VTPRAQTPASARTALQNFVVLFAPLLLLALAPGCERAQGQTSGAGGPGAGGAPPPPAVTVAQPILRELVDWDEYSGRLEAVEQVEVRPRVTGYLQQIQFTDGALVEKDAPLFVIDPRPYQADLERAQADVQRAQAQVSLAQSEFERAEKVVATNAVSQEEFETRKFTLAQQQAALASAKAAVDTAKLNLDYCYIKSPISGRISRRDVDAGNLVTGGTGSTATLLTTIVRADPIYCYVFPDERSVLKYQRLSREGRRLSARETKIPAFMALADEDNFAREGYVDFVDNLLDPTTGTIRARAVFDNPRLQLTPGLLARLRVPGSGRYEAMLVNDAAIGTDQATRFVMVVNADNKVEYHPIRVGGLFGQMRAVIGGIKPDDWIVINGLTKARPGAAVTPQRTGMPGNTGPMTGQGSPTTQALPKTTLQDEAAAQQQQQQQQQQSQQQSQQQQQQQQSQQQTHQPTGAAPTTRPAGTQPSAALWD
jgi:multidrug efflux system membrane fusion protein